MIKAVTTFNKTDYQRNERKMGAEVEISGNGMEIMHEFNGILDALEKNCPDIVLKVLSMHMEEKKKKKRFRT